MKIALTGATGFVGRVVAARLLAEGHKVSALVRSPETAQRLGNAELVHGDLHNADALGRLVDGADTVIHVAGAIAAPNRIAFFAANEAGVRNIVSATATAGVKRLVHVSTLSAKRPELTAYGASKAAGERILDEVGSGIAERLIIRPPAVYGPGDKATLPLVKALTNSPVVLAGHATSRFSLIYVDDLARIISEAAKGDQVGVLEVDDGMTQGYSWAELVEIAARVEGRALKPYFLPRALSMAIGAAAEGLAGLRGMTSLITRDKIRELYMPGVDFEPAWLAP